MHALQGPIPHALIPAAQPNEPTTTRPEMRSQLEHVRLKVAERDQAAMDEVAERDQAAAVEQDVLSNGSSMRGFLLQSALFQHVMASTYFCRRNSPNVSFRSTPCWAKPHFGILTKNLCCAVEPSAFFR